jgi:hypothetical protein
MNKYCFKPVFICILLFSAFGCTQQKINVAAPKCPEDSTLDDNTRQSAPIIVLDKKGNRSQKVLPGYVENRTIVYGLEAKVGQTLSIKTDVNDICIFVFDSKGNQLPGQKIDIKENGLYIVQIFNPLSDTRKRLFNLDVVLAKT